MASADFDATLRDQVDSQRFEPAIVTDLGLGCICKYLQRLEILRLVSVVWSDFACDRVLRKIVWEHYPTVCCIHSRGRRDHQSVHLVIFDLLLMADVYDWVVANGTLAI